MVIAALGHGPKALPGLANDPCLNPVIVIFFIKIIYYLAVKKAQHYLHCILNLLGLCRSSPVRASKSGLKTSEFSCKVKKSDHETAFIRKVIFERLVFLKRAIPGLFLFYLFIQTLHFYNK